MDSWMNKPGGRIGKGNFDEQREMVHGRGFFHRFDVVRGAERKA
jgi:hypothetical protein